jgi:hypothetical protein
MLTAESGIEHNSASSPLACIGVLQTRIEQLGLVDEGSLQPTSRAAAHRDAAFCLLRCARRSCICQCYVILTVRELARNFSTGYVRRRYSFR